MHTRTISRLVAALLSLTLVAAACGGDDTVASVDDTAADDTAADDTVASVDDTAADDTAADDTAADDTAADDTDASADDTAADDTDASADDTTADDTDASADDTAADDTDASADDAAADDAAADDTDPSGSAPTITLEIVDEQIVGGVRRESVSLGQSVTIVVTGDSTDEVHVHGYDHHIQLVDGGGQVTFDAVIPGVFEVELEAGRRLLIELEVS